MIRKIIALIAVLLMLSSSVSLTVVANPVGNGPGNSANAKACQKGGWQNLARLGSSGEPFSSQGECVSFGARGGVIVNLRGLKIDWRTSADESVRCAGFVSFSGFDDGQYAYVATWTEADGSLGGFGDTFAWPANSLPIDLIRANPHYGVHTITVEDVSISSTPDCVYQS